MTPKQLQSIIRRIKFEGVEFVYKQINSQEYGTKELNLRFIIQARFKRADTYSGKMGFGEGREWLLSAQPTLGEIVFTCWLAGMQIVEHESREGFTLDGVRLISPHMDPEKLKQLAIELGV